MCFATFKLFKVLKQKRTRRGREVEREKWLKTNGLENVFPPPAVYRNNYLRSALLSANAADFSDPRRYLISAFHLPYREVYHYTAIPRTNGGRVISMNANRIIRDKRAGGMWGGGYVTPPARKYKSTKTSDFGKLMLAGNMKNTTFRFVLIRSVRGKFFWQSQIPEKLKGFENFVFTFWVCKYLDTLACFR